MSNSLILFIILTVLLTAAVLALTARLRYVRKRYKSIINRLRQSEEKWLAIIEASPDGIGLVSLDGRLQLVSERLAEIFGYQPEEKDSLTGEMITGFIDISNHERLFNNISMLVNEDMKSSLREYTGINRKGGFFDIEVNSSLLRNSRGRPEAILFITRDITGRKNDERKLVEAKNEAEALRVKADEANREKSNFIAGMSHEIRTPINGIVSMTGLMLLEELTPRQKHFMQIIRSSSESLLEIVNDILDFSKIEAYRIDLEVLDFNLADVVNGIVELMNFRAGEKGLALTAHIDEKVQIFLRGDPSRLRQILLNLASNAIKFTKSGGVNISVKIDEEIEHWLKLRFSITDTGIGIPEAMKEKIFLPFVQADSSITRKYGGTGLGLAISRQLAELMGGAIGVDSIEGEGSTFWFTALFEKQEQQRAGRKTEPAVSGRGIFKGRNYGDVRILLAEDNYTNQIVTVEMLKVLGFENVDITENGYETLNALRAKEYDIVLMDCHMPELDGFGAARMIRDRNSGVLNSEIPVIALTALAMKSDREQALDAGMNDFLIKPVDLERLMSVVEKWLPPGLVKKAEADVFYPDAENFIRTSQPKAFNRDEFLSRLMGDEDLVKKITEAFLGDMPVQLEILEKALESSDCNMSVRQVHKMKSASANVGGELMRDIATAMEIAGNSGDMISMKKLYPELLFQYNVLKEQMTA